MPRMLALIVLCGMSIPVFSDDDRENCIFDFESFTPLGDSDDVIVDHSEQSIATLTEGSKTYRYITGPLKIKSPVDSSVYVYYSIAKESVGSIALSTRDACEFTANIYPQYLEPIAAMHNDLPPHPNICEMKPGTYNLWPANNSRELVAPSSLDEGKYNYDIIFFRDSKSVGGMSGVFNLLKA